MISSGPLEDRLAIRELVDSYNDTGATNACPGIIELQKKN